VCRGEKNYTRRAGFVNKNRKISNTRELIGSEQVTPVTHATFRFQSPGIRAKMPTIAGGGMDFIERIFGVSPDGGNGSLELLYLLIVATAAALLAVVRIRRHAAKTPPEKE
jgi:hypothetical protein